MVQSAASSVMVLERSSTIPRADVHRVAVGEVFITDLRPTDGGFAAAVQWPRRHHYFRTAGGGVDTTLVAETLRQATIALAHREFGVPRDFQFLMDRIAVRRLRTRSRTLAQDGALELRVDARGDLGSSRGIRQRLVVGIELMSGSQLLASARGWLRVVPAATYERMRPMGVAAVSSIDSDRWAGWSSEPILRGVALVPGAPGTWAVDVDASHPVFFDHPLDHLPGMAVMEAVELAVAAAADDDALRLVRYDVQHSSFIGLAGVTEVRVRELDHSPGAADALVEVLHDGVVAASASVSASSD